MLTAKQAGEMAAQLPGVGIRDHFGSDAYRTDGGIFATVWHERKIVNLKLTVEQQRQFVERDGEGFVEIDNAWGRQGWTTANLEFLEREDFEEALRSAWQNSATKAARRATKKTPKALKKKRPRKNR
jgi:hypothetical protein